MTHHGLMKSFFWVLAIAAVVPQWIIPMTILYMTWLAIVDTISIERTETFYG